MSIGTETQTQAKPTREERREQALARLQAAVESIQDSDTFKAFLKVGRRFHHYSWRNWLLIFSQRPDATHVAGYRAWQALGRQVRKGESGICIVAPVVKKDRETEDDVVVFFRTAYVFDISSTDGSELPHVPVPILTGTDGAAAYEQLAALARQHGTLIDDQPIAGSAAGYWDVSQREIHIDASQAQLQRTKTLAHELAHALAGHSGETPSAEAETVAEAVAFIVCDHFGLDTSERSFPYVANFSRDMETFSRVLGDIHRVSKLILDAFQPTVTS